MEIEITKSEVLSQKIPLAEKEINEKITLVQEILQVNQETSALEQLQRLQTELSNQWKHIQTDDHLRRTISDITNKIFSIPVEKKDLDLSLSFYEKTLEKDYKEWEKTLQEKGDSSEKDASRIEFIESLIDYDNQNPKERDLNLEMVVKVIDSIEDEGKKRDQKMKLYFDLADKVDPEIAKKLIPSF